MRENRGHESSHFREAGAWYMASALSAIFAVACFIGSALGLFRAPSTWTDSDLSLAIMVCGFTVQIVGLVVLCFMVRQSPRHSPDERLVMEALGRDWDELVRERAQNIRERMQ